MCAILAAGAGATGCGVTGGNSGAPPPPPPPPISVSVSPPSAGVPLGAAQQFTATVSNTSNTAVNWNVNGLGGGNSVVGTISASGLYTAPQILTAQNPVSIQAVSQADNSKSGTATVTVMSDISVSVMPATADVELGATRQFQASISGSGNPNHTVTWSVAGVGCAGAGCGTTDTNGLFTAPPARPSPPGVTLTARSIADPSKSATAAVNITSSFTFSVAGPSSVPAGGTASFAATLTPVPNSNPSTVLSWSVSGPGCAGSACGNIVSTGINTANYTAPATPPSPNTVSVIATPAADPAKAASVTLTITSPTAVAVQVAPAASTRAVNHRQTFSVQVTGTSNQNVTWQVNSTPGGDTTVGQICVAGVDPCQPVATTNGGSVDYLAPSSVPSRNPVTISAVSIADPTKSSSAQVTILAHILVNVAPPSVTLAPHATQQFNASVEGTSNQAVTWQVFGPACGGAGSPCGGIDSTGFYTAPLAPPTPNTVAVTATSSEDTSRSGFAAVTIATGATITALLPASVTAGAAGGFTLKVQGASFIPSSSGPGSTILFNSGPRTTDCPSTNECTTTLTAADVASPASLPVQIRNPDNSTSNQVLLVVVPPTASDDVIPLSAAAPSVAGKDIVVVEPTTAGTSTDLNLNVVAIGFYSTSDNTCVLGSNPLVFVRPASGSATADICAFSLSGLDPALNYTLTGPVPNDISIVAKQPLGLGIIHLTLQLPSNALPGPRTLFVENANKDKTAATGALEVK